MATVTTNVDSTAYVQVSIAACFMQNMSAYPAYFAFSLAQPSANTTVRHLLPAGEGYTRVGSLPSGNLWVICGAAGESSDISVSE